MGEVRKNPVLGQDTQIFGLDITKTVLLGRDSSQLLTRDKFAAQHEFLVRYGNVKTRSYTYLELSLLAGLC